MSKIVFVCPQLGVGGAERHLIRYANGLAERKQSITIIVTGSNIELSKELSPLISLHKLESRVTNPICWWRLQTLLKWIKPDYLVGWSTYSNFLVAMSVRRNVRKVIVCELNYPPLEYRLNGYLQYYILLLLTIFLYRRADVVTANSDKSLHVLSRWVGSGRTYLRLFNPIEFDRITSLAAEPFEAPEFEPGIKILLAVGRIDIQHKGFDILLKALYKLSQHRLDWRCLIVGEGPDEHLLRQLADVLGISDMIFLCGRKINPFPYFKRADIFIMPSRREGFPNVLLEAMALGTAVVATDCMTGPREITDNGRCGKIVPVDDVASLCKAITELIERPHERRLLGATGKAWIAENYSENKVFNQLMKLFE